MDAGRYKNTTINIAVGSVDRLLLKKIKNKVVKEHLWHREQLTFTSQSTQSWAEWWCYTIRRKTELPWLCWGQPPTATIERASMRVCSCVILRQHRMRTTRFNFLLTSRFQISYCYTGMWDQRVILLAVAHEYDIPQPQEPTAFELTMTQHMTNMWEDWG